jgi:D-arabinono-1,4-lactone oxidase
MPKTITITLADGRTMPQNLPVQGRDGLYHPSNEQEIQAIVRYAYENNLTVRVCGSRHSHPRTITFTDSYDYTALQNYTPEFLGSDYDENFDPILTQAGEINIMLDLYRDFLRYDSATHSWVNGFNDAQKQVTVQAGCNLSYDPYDPTQRSRYDNSLLVNLQRRGWALPDLGGIAHQTVGGFLSTGSSGGSLMYSLDDAIKEIRIINGKGDILVCSETQNTDWFYAAGVSMGLLGIISTVTFQCLDSFNIYGDEAIYHIASDTYNAPIDFFGERKNLPSLEKFLYEAPYSRLLWWPQKGVEKMVVWQAKRMTDADYNNPNACPWKKEGFEPKPYQEFPWLIGLMDSPVLAESLGGLFYTLIGRYPAWLVAVENPSLRGIIEFAFDKLFKPLILPFVINLFVTADSDKDGSAKGKPQRFWDTWWRGLPMDNQVDDTIMGTCFTELWIPIEQTEAVMKALRQLYVTNGFDATGTFSCEIYATKPSKFWFSPAYDANVLRVDIFWFLKNITSPTTYYKQFWDVLKPFSFRPHWGKYLPGSNQSEYKAWQPYLAQQYSHWNDFMRLREESDPKQVFVTEYWAEHLGIPASPERIIQRQKAAEYRKKQNAARAKEEAEEARINAEVDGNSPPSPMLLPWMQYVISYLVTFASAWLITGVLLCDVLHTFEFTSTLSRYGSLAALTLLIGSGIVWLRCFMPLVLIVAVLGVYAVNLLNSLANSVWWTWLSVWIIPVWLVALVAALIEALAIPLLSSWIQAPIIKALAKIFPANDIQQQKPLQP